MAFFWPKIGSEPNFHLGPEPNFENGPFYRKVLFIFGNHYKNCGFRERPLKTGKEANQKNTNSSFFFESRVWNNYMLQPLTWTNIFSKHQKQETNTRKWRQKDRKATEHSDWKRGGFWGRNLKIINWKPRKEEANSKGKRKSQKEQKRRKRNKKERCKKMKGQK